MDRLTADDPEWIRRFALILMSNVDLSLHAIDDLLIRNPSRRIAAVLVRCLGDEGGGTLSISQTELGRLSNTSRKVVNRTLDRYAELGWINQGYGRIEVADATALRFHSYEP
ncbi:Crp/Fnr family transcriptional regulator [Palleronia sp. KMU-117]|uniref:Crp/Fnr family transcriptional regulator n=1 Tax=Palleronia sp. KMU-117 TaxID=3434108 RepID=UPI003D713C0E